MVVLARRFARERLGKRREVVGVLLRGSSVIGVRDEFVDLDLDIVVTDEFFSKIQPTSNEECFEGVPVCWDYKSPEIIEAELREWLRDTDLWAYSTAEVMYDPNRKIRTLLDGYRQYPESVRMEKMFSYFYHATAASPYNSGKAIQRREYATAQLFLTNAAELYTAILYLINKSFIPYRKWRIRQLTTLARKPDNYEERISKVLFGDKSPIREVLQNKHLVMTGIVDDIRSMLLQEGLDSRKLSDDLWRYEPKYLPSI